MLPLACGVGGGVVIWSPGLGLIVPIWGDCVLSCLSIRLTEMFQGNCKPRACLLVKSPLGDLFQVSFGGLQGDSGARHRTLAQIHPLFTSDGHRVHRASSVMAGAHAEIHPEVDFACWSDHMLHCTILGGKGKRGSKGWIHALWLS